MFPGDTARRLARRMPKPIRAALRGGYMRYRSVRYRIRERLVPTNLTSEDVAAALRKCGLGEGDACFVQSAMSAFGRFENGPDTVLAGIQSVVGDRGLVAMPAYPLARPAIQYLEANAVFDVRQTPSRMGAISEAFRLMPGTRRSIHPTHSTCARGIGAEEIVAGHEFSPTPFGESTPFIRIRNRSALQIFFGCGTGAITMYHSFECTRVPPFPIDVFSDRVMKCRCIDEQGREIEVRTLVHDPDLHAGRIDSSVRLQNVYRQAILEAGGAAVKLGRGEIIAIRLPMLFDVFEKLLGEGTTIYDREVPSELPTLPPQERIRDAR
jgi:aminoglycoside 3-N-acetyltransferase